MEEEVKRCLKEFLRECIKNKKCAAHLMNPVRFLLPEVQEEWEAYAEVYGVSDTVAAANGSRLLGNAEVQQALKQLEQGAEILCSLTKEELISDLAEILRSKPQDAAHDNPLCELVMTKVGPAALFPSKTQAASLLSRLCGWDKAKIDLEVSGETEFLNMLRGLTGAKEEEK